MARSHIFEGREHLTAALAVTKPEPARPARARALWGAASMLAWQGETSAAKVWMDEALEAWRKLDDDAEVALALEGIGWTQFFSSEDEAARASFEECLRIQSAAGDPVLINRARVGLAQVLVALDRTKEARSMAEEIIRFSTTHNDKRSEHFGWHYLADCALIEQSYEESLELYKKSLELVNRLGDKIEIGFEIQGVAMSLSGLARSQEATVLAAAVDAEMDRIGADVHVRFWDALTDRHFNAAKIDLGDEAHGLAQSEGSAIPFERAVEIALGSEAKERT
jgi:tetratricopeptide (TPR) repeat protein